MREGGGGGGVGRGRQKTGEVGGRVKERGEREGGREGEEKGGGGRREGRGRGEREGGGKSRRKGQDDPTLRVLRAAGQCRLGERSICACRLLKAAALSSDKDRFRSFPFRK